MSLVTSISAPTVVNTVLSVPDDSAVGTTVLGTLETALSVTTGSSVSLVNTGLVGPPGPQGEQGEQGIPGPVGEYYKHDQVIAADTWVVNHNFGIRPLCSAFTVGGMMMWADIQHTSINQITIYFDAPVSGYAVCT